MECPSQAREVDRAQASKVRSMISSCLCSLPNLCFSSGYMGPGKPVSPSGVVWWSGALSVSWCHEGLRSGMIVLTVVASV